MANYQLGPVIGKLGGGADVQKIPVEAVADGAANSEVVVHTVHVPEGETWLVVLSGDFNPAYTNTNGPQLFIGADSIGPHLPRGLTAFAAEVTGTAEIGLRRTIAASIDSFSGHVYVAPLPD